MGATATPLRILRQVSHKVPQTPELELGGAALSTEPRSRTRVQWPNAATLGESNPFDLDEWPRRANRLPPSAPVSVSPAIPHGCTTSRCGAISPAASATITTRTTEDVLERAAARRHAHRHGRQHERQYPHRLRRRAGAGRRRLFHICFCADDKHVEDLHDQGHIDHHVREAIRAGVAPMLAWRMATLTRGALLPARPSDRLDHPEPARRYPAGARSRRGAPEPRPGRRRVVAENGKRAIRQYATPCRR